LDLTVDEVKQITPDVRVIRGFATVTPKIGAAVATRYVSINVKNGDQWLISQLTETEAPPPSAEVVAAGAQLPMGAAEVRAELAEWEPARGVRRRVWQRRIQGRVSTE
jgi:hypothetical protein